MNPLAMKYEDAIERLINLVNEKQRVIANVDLSAVEKMEKVGNLTEVIEDLKVKMCGWRFDRPNEIKI